MASIQQNGQNANGAPSTSVLPAQSRAQFTEILKGSRAEIVYPGESGYGELIKRWSETCEKQAAAVFLPKTAEDIARAVDLLRETRTPFTVAGGRHSTSGSSAIQDGVVIDMRRMRKVVVDPAAETITAEGGCTWADVDVAAAKFGLATVGGTVNTTGVGGLTLGGGYGWLTGRYGLAIDNLLSVKMVLADGRVVTTSKDSHPDLFWAIRGAGQCFGIAAELAFQAYPQGDVWGGIYVFTHERLSKVIEFANWSHENTNGDQALVVGISKSPDAPSVLIMVAAFYNGREEDALQYYKPLADLEPIVTKVTAMSYENLNGMFNGMQKEGGRKIFGGSNVGMPLDPAFVQTIYNEFASFVSSHRGTVGGVIAFELIPYKKVSAVDLEETALANRGDYYNVCTLFNWTDSAIDTEVRQFNRKINATIREQGGQKKTKGVGVYSNYLQESCPPKEVFGSNTPRLRELKMKYDPDNLFRRWHNLLPKLAIVCSNAREEELEL